MTSFLLSFGWNWLLVPVLLYLAHRYYKATREQPLKYLQHTTVTVQKPFAFDNPDYKKYVIAWGNHFQYRALHPEPPEKRDFELSETSHLLELMRRERWFPWRYHRETWLVCPDYSTRESDGIQENGPTHKRFLGMIAVAEARKLEIEELSK